MGLAGKRIVVTRAVHQAPELIRLLTDAGATVVPYPTIAVRPVTGDERRHLDRALANLRARAYSAVLFTSANAVEELFAAVGGELDGTPAFAVGNATARAIATRGLAAEVSEEATGAGLARAVAARFGELRAQRFLVPAAREGRTDLIDALRGAGAEVDRVVVYDTVPLRDGPPLPAGGADWVLFMSPSAVTGFVARAHVPPGARVACIGPTTAEAAGAAGLAVDLVPVETSAPGLVAALAAA
jgi:uroporphyrinogen-III synthase